MGIKINEILKKYEKKHTGILEAKKKEREKKISGRWDINKLLKNRGVGKKNDCY